MTTPHEQVMQAFEAFKTEIQPKIAKLDALDEVKFAKLEKVMGDAVEASQAEAGKLAAVEAELKAVQTFINRPGAAQVKDETKESITKAFNEFARTNASEKGDFRDFLQKNGKDVELKALSVNVDANGGYLVQTAFGGIIQNKIFETSPMRQLATIETISSDSLELVTDGDEAQTAWVGEVTARTDTTTPVFGKLIIPTFEIYTQPKATQKLLDDAAIDAEAWLAAKVAEAIGRKENTAFVTGDGAIQPRGIMSYTAGTTIASGQVQQVNMGSTTAFVYDGLVDVQNALKEDYQSNATWLMQRASFGTLMKLKTGITSDNTPVFNMTYANNNGLATFDLLGRPVKFASDIASIASASLSVAYGDFKKAYTIVDRTGLRTLRDPYTAKPYVVFYTTKRTGGAVVNYEAYKISKFS